MKRSGTMGLVLMGTTAFAATFAGGMAYMHLSKPQSTAAQAAAGNCNPRPDGTCEPARRGGTGIIPMFFGSRSAPPSAASAATTRGGFGKTAQSRAFRAGG